MGESAIRSDVVWSVVGMSPLTLQIQNARSIESPKWETVERAFAKWDTLRRGFFVLSDTAGNYVQTAGASYKAIVEWRQMREDGKFSHFVLGHPDRESKATSIYSSIGILKLHENEIFALDEVLEIFHSFYDHRTVPDRFTRRDDTARFIRGSRSGGGESPGASREDL
jgi:hypothetical protein